MMINNNFSVLYAQSENTKSKNYLTHLSSFFSEVYEAIDGNEILELYYDKKPDFLIVDLEIKSIDTIEIIKKIREQDNLTKIIVLTAQSSVEKLLSSIPINLIEYLIKPVSEDTFKNTIEKYLNDIYKKSKIIIFQNGVDTLEYDQSNLLLFNNSKEISLTKYETVLFDFLYKFRNKVVTKDEINYNVWDKFNKNATDHGIRNLIKNLNKKLPNKLITNVYGDGYRLKTRDKQLVNKYSNEYNENQEQYFSQTILKGTEAFFLLDINNLNIINKSHGYLVGNILIDKVEQLLKSITPDYIDVYRVSDGRFGMVLQKYDMKQIEFLSNIIIAFFENYEIEIEDKECSIGLNIGISKVVSERDVMIDSEFALNCSKKYRKNFFIFCEKEFDEVNENLQTIDNFNKIKKFIHDEMITPWLQPIIDVKNDTVYKYESLARIVDKDTVYYPIQFLEVIKKLGLSETLTKNMINETFKLFSGTNTRFSINISEEDVMNDYLVHFVEYKLNYYNILPNQVTFEVLENVTLNVNTANINNTIKGIQDLGCSIAIDDFGSDNSNFGRILSFQSDYIKIDKIFIEDCDIDKNKRVVISAIVQLANHLNIKTIAEFVDKESVYKTIKELGVDFAQGYFLGKPSPNLLDEKKLLNFAI